MKDKIAVIKNCVKDGNISPQLNNIEFTDDSITVYKDGNLVVTNNDTNIRGYLNGKEFIKSVNSFNEPNFIDSEKSLIIKEGRRKVTLSKYILSGGEQQIELPKSENEIVEILLNTELFNAIKFCMYSAKENNINASGDGIILDFSGKFKKVYASNGIHFTISNVFSKENFKVFIPYFIVDSISKYYIENSTIKVTNNYVSYDNNEYKFISLYSITDEVTDINNILGKINVIHKNIKLNEEMVNALNNVISLTDKKVTFEFKKNHIHLYGYSNNSIIEDSVETDIPDDIEVSFNKDYIKHGIKNFKSFDLCQLKDSNINFIKFRNGKVNFYISPLSTVD